MFSWFLAVFNTKLGENKVSIREKVDYALDKICASKHPMILSISLVLFVLSSVCMMVLSTIKYTIDEPISITIVVLLYFILMIAIIKLTPSHLQVILSRHKKIDEAVKVLCREYEDSKIAVFQKTCKEFGWNELTTAEWVLREIEAIEKSSEKGFKFLDYLKNYIVLICYPAVVTFIGPFIDIVNSTQDLNIQLKNLTYIVTIVLIIAMFCFLIGMAYNLLFAYPSKKETALTELKEISLYYIYQYCNKKDSIKIPQNKVRKVNRED